MEGRIDDGEFAAGIDRIAVQNNQHEKDIKKLMALLRSCSQSLDDIENSICDLRCLEFEPDNAKTVVMFQCIEPENALAGSCVNEFVNEMELTKVHYFISEILSKHFDHLTQYQRRIMACGMDGICRHFPLLNRLFPGYKIYAVDAS